MAVEMITLSNGVSVELILGDGREWLGIGAVSLNGVPFRDGRRPLVLRIDTPDGYLYTRYTLTAVAADSAGVKATFAAEAMPWCRQEYVDEYEQPQYTIAESFGRPVDTVTLRFEPVTETIGDRTWSGFAWSIGFESNARPIHRILVDGTWELGGTLTGNTVLSQGQCNMPVYRGAKDTLFTTACLKALHLHGTPQGFSFQLAPRGGLVQAFDFQYGTAGALLLYWPVMDSISCVLESPKGSDRLHVVDEYRFTLAQTASTTPQRVLFTPSPIAEHEARDAWWDAISHIYGSMRARYGVRETRSIPEAHKIGYPAAKDGTVKATILGHEVEHQDYIDAIAEWYLPKMAKNGLRRLFMETMCQSDATELGLRRKLDTGAHGDLHCGSVCATWRYFPSDFWGGIAAWKRLYTAAKKLGIEIGTWASPHLSHNAPIFKEHPEWKITGVNSLANGGGYGIHSINALDWNTGIFDWILADLRRWKEEGGYDYLWLDSWSNLGLLPINYAAGMRTNWDALSRFCGELSRMGTNLAFESLSPFGVMACGLADLRGFEMGQNHAVAGQNDFGWWVGSEDMLYNVSMYDIHPRDRSDDEVYGIKFRAMANRGFITLPGLISTTRDMPERHILLHHAYDAVLPHMTRRRLLPGGLGVRWTGGAAEVVWTYCAGAIPVAADCTVLRRCGSATTEVACDGLLRFSANEIYEIRNRA